MRRALEDISRQTKNVMTLAYGGCAIQDSPTLVLFNASDDNSVIEVRIELTERGANEPKHDNAKSHVGDDTLWRNKLGKDFTRDLSKAPLSDEEQALRQRVIREALKDIVRQTKYILNLAYGFCAIEESPNYVVFNACDDKSDMEVRINLTEDDGNDLFYLQDTRSHAGNDMRWLSRAGEDYTTDLRHAQLYTQEQVLKQYEIQENVTPWPKHYVDTNAQPSVDMQNVDIDAALDGTGIELR